MKSLKKILNEKYIEKGGVTAEELFNIYVKKIYDDNKGEVPAKKFWQDFPVDFWRENMNLGINWWGCYKTAENEEDYRIHNIGLKYIKCYIDFIKKEYPIVNDSAKEFWQHWLALRKTYKDYIKAENNDLNEEQKELRKEFVILLNDFIKETNRIIYNTLDFRDFFLKESDKYNRRHSETAGFFKLRAVDDFVQLKIGDKEQFYSEQNLLLIDYKKLIELIKNNEI